MVTTESRNSNVNQVRQIENERHALRDAERDVAASLGVGFDGQFYRYRTFRYARCADAISYAKLDRDKPQFQAKAINALPWEKPVEPTEQEQREMTALGITFDGMYYLYAGYRYEHCADAANYAKLCRRENRR